MFRRVQGKTVDALKKKKKKKRPDIDNKRLKHGELVLGAARKKIMPKLVALFSG